MYVLEGFPLDGWSGHGPPPMTLARDGRVSPSSCGDPEGESGRHPVIRERLGLTGIHCDADFDFSPG